MVRIDDGVRGTGDFTGVCRYRKLGYLEFYPLVLSDLFSPFLLLFLRTWLLLHAGSRIKEDLAMVVAILISVSTRPTNSRL